MRKHVVILVLIWGSIGDLTEIQTSAAQQLLTSALSVDAVMQQLQEKRDLMLVDVREPQAFEQVRIPGSLNIPLFAVKTKPFLTTKPLVLVDEGYRPRRLAEVCEQLTQAGFDAHFLFGGLNAWRTRRAPRRWASPSGWRPSGSVPATRPVLPLHGDVLAQNALNTMPPRAWFAEQGGEYWLLIDVSANPLPRGEVHPPGPPQGGNTHSQPPSTGRRTGLPDNAVDVSPGSADILSASDACEAPALPGVGETPALPGGGLFSQARSVPFDRDNPEPVLPHLEHAIADAAVRSELFLVLIYNQYGEDYEQIERMLRNADIAPVFFLQGGIDAYQKFLDQQGSIRRAKAHSEKTLKTCPRCQ